MVKYSQVTDGSCRPDSVVAGANYRFTFLTPRLVRLEYDPEGIFENRPSQLAINRKFETPRFIVREDERTLEVDTEFLSVSYNKEAFSSGGLLIKVRSKCRGIYSTWHYGDTLTENLWGTARTLDQADGEVPLEVGIQSRLQGYSVLDDSHSLLSTDGGWIAPRREGTQDIYFLGYGYDYQGCLNDFFRLSGSTPLLPRYVFGNWWSRFYAYSGEEYLALMDRFAAEGVPLSVAVLDMDWHVTNIEPKYGKGWTGYTWNRKLFPDPEEFLKQLHDRNLKVTLNLHPAEGVQPHEEQYAAMSTAMGRDPAMGQSIHFDFCDPAFVEAYFQYLIRPEEERGVDFWWIDWQQGNTARYPGADPLWLLNHFHFLDSAKSEKRPLVFSRYAGPGSHRYPIGFSGDSIISWDSLAFQPYFTATAANIGYGWWSHDIGGHCAGVKDGELLVRWVQFGVFSPVMRLHSTSNLFNGKEPWKYDAQTSDIMKRYLRLRHRLVPYLYTMNRRCNESGELLVRPMYYSYPEEDAAYEVPNQYEFGSELIVCPITSPMDLKLKLGKTTAWLPKGLYFDFFSGLCYNGQRKINLYRPLDSIPVFAKAGAIVPLADGSECSQNGAALPETIEFRIFAGDNGHFELYEDDGETMDYAEGQYALTKLDFTWSDGNQSSFTIEPPSSPVAFLPPERFYIITIVGVAPTENITVTVDDAVVNFEKHYDSEQRAITLELPKCKSTQIVTVLFGQELHLAGVKTREQIFNLLDPMEIGFEQKEQIFNCISNSSDTGHILCELQTMDLSRDILGAVSEILCSANRYWERGCQNEFYGTQFKNNVNSARRFYHALD